MLLNLTCYGQLFELGSSNIRKSTKIYQRMGHIFVPGSWIWWVGRVVQMGHPLETLLGFTHGWNKFYQRNQFSLSNPTNHHSSNHWVTNQITTRRVESQALHSNVPRVFHESHNLEIALWVRVVGVGQFSLWIRPLSAEHWSQEYPEHPEEDLQDFRGAEMRLDFC